MKKVFFPVTSILVDLGFVILITERKLDEPF